MRSFSDFSFFPNLSTFITGGPQDSLSLTNKQFPAHSVPLRGSRSSDTLVTRPPSWWKLTKINDYLQTVAGCFLLGGAEIQCDLDCCCTVSGVYSGVCCLFHKHENLCVTDQGHLCCSVLGCHVRFMDAGACTVMVRSPSPRDQPHTLPPPWLETARSLVVLYCACLHSLDSSPGHGVLAE